MDDENMVFEDGGKAFSSERVEAQVNFPGLVWKQIQKINYFGSLIASDNLLISFYCSSVFELDSLLEAYKDKTYEEEVEDIQRENHELISKVMEHRKNKNIKIELEDSQVYLHLRVYYSQKHCKILMRLLVRKNFFPGKRVSLNYEE